MTNIHAIPSASPVTVGQVQPEGLEYDSPGQGPGWTGRHAKVALKGRNRRHETELRPFRALGGRGTQIPRALPWAVVSAPLRGSPTATLAVLLLAGFVGWGVSPSAVCAEIAGKAGAPPEPTVSAQPDSPPGADRGRASTKARSSIGAPARGRAVRPESSVPPGFALPSRGRAPAKEPRPAPTVKPLDPEKTVPKRELVFDQSEEEYVLTADPSRYGPKFVELLQDRYVAVLKLEFRERGLHEKGPFENDLSNSRGIYHFPVNDPADLATRAPRDRRPSAETMGMLTRVQYLRLDKVIRSNEEEPRRADGRLTTYYTNRFSFELDLTAPTAERAKELAQSMLALYDYGHSFPAYCGYAGLYDYFSSQLSDERARIKAMQDELLSAEKELPRLKPYEEVTSEALASLVSQKQLNNVERAGVLARIAASRKILDEMKKSGRPNAPQAEKTESVMIAAEIDLASLEAKQSAIDLLVQESRRRLQLESSARRLRQDIEIAEREGVGNLEPRVAGYKKALDEKMPFAKVEGKVLIRRIKWEQPKPAAKQ